MAAQQPHLTGVAPIGTSTDDFGSLPVAAGAAAAASGGDAAFADRVPASGLSQLPALQPQRASAVSLSQPSGNVTYIDCPSIGCSFLLGKTLADSLMGKVKLAQKHTLHPDGSRTNTGEAVAIKVLLKSCIRGRVTRDGRRVDENPEEEIQAMMFLGAHPHLLNLQTLASDEQHVFLVMDLAPGGDLFGRVSLNADPPSRLAEADARRYFLQLALGVQYMHSRGIVHRDLSLENVMLDGNDCVKVIDFGLMKQVTLPAGGPLGGKRVGKGGYMPPEVYRASNLTDARSVDVWCMGVMLFIMLFGVPPYRTADAARCRLFAELSAGRLLRLINHWGMQGHASDEAKDLVVRMLQPVAAERPSLAEILQHPWLAEQHAEYRDAVLPGTNHDELVAWMEGATAEAQTQGGAGYLSAARVAAAPGAWGEQWRRGHGLPSTAPAAAVAAVAAPPVPEEGEEDSTPIVLPSDVSGASGAGLHISAPPQFDDDGDLLG